MSKDIKGGIIGPRLSVLFGFFIIMLIAVSFCQSFISELPINERTKLLTVSAIQCVLAFILPAYIMARISSSEPFSLLGLSQKFSFKSIIGVIIIFIIGLPFLNQLVYWNESLSLPESLKGVENFFRGMEDRAATTTDIILKTDSFGGMVSGVLIIGILTGLSEEILFRGALQRTIFLGNRSAAFAIWITALVFSFMHFQFFGFVPRVLLGAFFGYLLYWTGSLWPAIIAHALNNSIVVVGSWMEENSIISSDPGSYGLVTEGLPWPCIISFILLVLFFYFFRLYFFNK